LVETLLHSPALEGNLLGDSPDRSITIYLPPEYGEHPARRYPVLYLLPGSNQTDRSFAQATRIKATADALIDEQRILPLIVVIPDANNRYTGSQYVNSVVTGNWEDFVTRELVEHVDGAFRTISERGGRGIAGYSMGGTGAIRLAMRHPDIYQAVYTMSASSLAFDEKWMGRVRDRILTILDIEELGSLPLELLKPISSAAAYAPNPDTPPFLADFPLNRDGEVVEAVWQRWLVHDPLSMIASHRESLLQLSGVFLDCGTEESLLPDHRIYSQALTAAGIPHVYEEYVGSHSSYPARIPRVLSFFSEQFSQGITGIRVLSALLIQESAVSGQPLQVDVEVTVAGPSDVTADYPAMALDLSSLGLEDMLPLEADGDGGYSGSRWIDSGVDPGLHFMPLQVRQSDGSWDTARSLTLTVWPATDVPVYLDACAPGWKASGRGLENLTLSQTDVVHAGAAACAVQGEKSFAGWVAEFQCSTSPNGFGYALRLSLHPGDLALSTSERFALSVVPGKAVSLREWMDMGADEWQVVEIPMEVFELKGR